MSHVERSIISHILRGIAGEVSSHVLAGNSLVLIHSLAYVPPISTHGVPRLYNHVIRQSLPAYLLSNLVNPDDNIGSASPLNKGECGPFRSSYLR